MTAQELERLQAALRRRQRGVTTTTMAMSISSWATKRGEVLGFHASCSATTGTGHSLMSPSWLGSAWLASSRVSSGATTTTTAASTCTCRASENRTTCSETRGHPLTVGGRSVTSRLPAGVEQLDKSFPTLFFDYDNDGWLDLFVNATEASLDDITAEYLRQSHTAEDPRLYRNQRDGTFVDVTKAAGLDTISLTMGFNYGDLDNDGFLDLYLGTGAPAFDMLIPNRVFRNVGGARFEDVTAAGGFGHVQKGHGGAFGDIEHDGDQDLYIVLGGAAEADLSQNVLLLNPGHGNAWITLKLRGTASNRLAIGARIQARRRNAKRRSGDSRHSRERRQLRQLDSPTRDRSWQCDHDPTADGRLAGDRDRYINCARSKF